MLTISASQMRMFEAHSEANFRCRLREFIGAMLTAPFARDMQSDVSGLTDRTMALAEQFGFIQQDHIAALAVILVSISCSTWSPDEQRAMFKILENTHEPQDQRIVDCAHKLGIGAG